MYSTTDGKIKLGSTNLFGLAEKETDLIFAIKKLIDGKKEVIVEITEQNVCYWVRSTRDRKDYLLEIKKYQSTTGKCIGSILNESHIALEHGINIIGDTDCLCNVNTYQLEWKNGLKISGSTKITPVMFSTTIPIKTTVPRITSTTMPTEIIERIKHAWRRVILG